jgi:hypothetical protein
MNGVITETGEFAQAVSIIVDSEKVKRGSTAQNNLDALDDDQIYQ